MTPGPLQIALVLVLLIFLFGAKRIPDIMENIAKGVKSFKGGLKEDDDVSPKPVDKKDDKGAS
ncbi:twin-arginine translocase TatA/TatE family subunit [Alphaproteobacteria bacterium]|nr:twin-arginine translocase TatA/TatE family subunit [Alphaproteobacteria bacterium]